jgi:hypothetical protein
MGTGMNKVERYAAYKVALQNYQDFKQQFDLNPIVDYFTVGLEAKIFKNPLNNKPLTKNDNLFWGFNHDGYQYTLRRQRIAPPTQFNNPLGSLLKTTQLNSGAVK